MKTQNHPFTLEWPGSLRLLNENGHFIARDWDDAIARAIAQAAKQFIPGVQFGEAKFEEEDREDRDDNGDYSWTGSYKRGDAEHHVVIGFWGYRGEDLVYPTPMGETRKYKACGLKEDQKIEVSLSYKQYAVMITSMKMSVTIEGDATVADEVRKLFVRDFAKVDGLVK